MLIKKLVLANFRNYSKLDFEFSETPTIFTGLNGAGKSNILEALYLLATTKSPRIEEEIEFIKKSTEAATIKGFISDGGDTNELLITLAGNSSFVGTDSDIKRFGKRVSVNGVGKRIIDFIGIFPCVIFWPADINMITGSPSLRRWHLDLSLAQTHRGYKDGVIPYKKALTLYEQVLSSRNKVLRRIKEGQGRPDELKFWTDELIKYGDIISSKRKEYFEFINQFSNPLGNFKFEYKQNILSLEKLEKYRDREVAAMSTLIGPHRDDFQIFLDDRNMAKFGSRGEQRMATLAFKIAQLEMMAYILGERPTLLLDDVFSELDMHHRAVVADVARKQQTIIATVELENIPQDFLDSSRILRVEDGRLLSEFRNGHKY